MGVEMPHYHEKVLPMSSENDKSPWWFTVFPFVLSVCALVIAFVALYTAINTLATVLQYAENTKAVVYSETDSKASLAPEISPDDYDAVYADDGTVSYYRKGELTAEERNQIGRVECEPATLDEMIEAGCLEVGKTRYTYVTDDVLSFSVLASQIDGWHADDEGVYRDGNGYVVCGSGIRAIGDHVKTPLGDGVVYDCTGSEPTIVAFVSKDRKNA